MIRLLSVLLPVIVVSLGALAIYRRPTTRRQKLDRARNEFTACQVTLAQIAAHTRELHDIDRPLAALINVALEEHEALIYQLSIKEKS